MPIKRVGAELRIEQDGIRASTIKFAIIGIVVVFLGIRHGELSGLYPMGYIWTLLWARSFFKEAFTRQKLAGLVLILVGVFLVGLGSK